MDSIRLVEFVGLPSALGWSHVTTLLVPSGAQGILCFSVAGVRASAVGHELVALTRSSSLESEKDLYDLVISLNAKTQERSCRLSVVAGYIDGERGSWITYGGVVGLQRAGKFGRALASSDLQMRTGSVRAQDIFMLATTAAAGMLDDVSELFAQGYQLAGIESSLERLIRTQPQQDLSALALVECFFPEEEGDNVAPDPIRSLEDVALLSVERSISPAADLSRDESASELTETDIAVGSVETLPPAPVASEPVAKIAKPHPLAGVTPFLRKLGAKLRLIAGKVCRSVARFLTVAGRGVKQLPWQSWRESKRVRTLAAIVVALVLISLVAFLTISWQQRKTAAQAESLLAPFKLQLGEVQAQASSDPLAAQSQLIALTTSVSEQAATASSKSSANALQGFLSELRSYEDQLKGEQAVRSLPVFMDLQAVIPGFVASVSDGLPGAGIYVDTAKKVALLVKFDTQEVLQFDLATIETIKSISLRSLEEAVILGDGIYALELTSGALPEIATAVGDSNREATLIGSYDSYVYIFNPEKRNIYRYLVRNDGYSDPIGWLLSPLGVAAESVHSMKVDGDVWIGTTDGQLKKFTSGRATGFAISNLEQPLEGSVQVYTSELDQYLYLFVPGQERVVVMTKDGIFVKQIKSEVLSGATGAIANEPAGQLFAISGSVIYQAPL